VLRAASVALTEKVWEPLANPVYSNPVYFLGWEHALKGALSREHSKVKHQPHVTMFDVRLHLYLLPSPMGLDFYLGAHFPATAGWSRIGITRSVSVPCSALINLRTTRIYLIRLA
jgi:hypothetical protein